VKVGGIIFKYAPAPIQERQVIQRTESGEQMSDRPSAEDVVAEAGKAIDKKTLRLLEQDAEKCSRRGQLILGVAIALGVLLILGAYFLTELSVKDLQKANDPPLMLVLLLVRGTLFGGLSAGFLYGVFTIGNAYIDQSTRFRKRVYSAHMLNYAFDTFSDEIKRGGRVEVDDLVRLFYAWNANVDSAFSRVAFQKASKNLVIGSGSHRLAVEDPLHKEESQSHSREGAGIAGIPIIGELRLGGNSYGADAKAES
jgi:hypothetical protein